MKHKLGYLLTAALAMVLTTAGIISTKSNSAVEPTFATYTNGDAATYYNSIDSTQTGNTLLTALRTLNLSKRQSTVGYSSMGTDTSGQFKYTDYDTNYVQYDSNGQPYGTRISSFYTFTSATGWNREHVWPNSHGGGSKGDSGTPYVDADIHMPRPTISSENSSRGNSFFVEGMNNSSSGWDPYTAGYSELSRGEAARITFYCTLVNSKLILAPNNTTPSGTDSVTGQSFGSGHTMGNLETLIKWNINYPVSQREKNRNEGAEYLQGNRNAFVDHPEYACKIWGSVNSTIKTMCDNASWDTGPSVSVSKSTASLVVDDTTTISASASDSSTITWTSSDTTVVTVSSASASSGSNITLTAVGPGTATVTARATINSTQYSATCTVTVSSSGSGGGGDSGDGDNVTIAVSDIPSQYSSTSFTAGDYTFGCSNIGNSYSSGNMQWKSGQGYLYNTTPISGITSISMASPTTGSFTGTVYVGSSSHPTSGTSYTLTSGSSVNISGSPSYFTIQAGTVSGGAKSGGITINRTSSEKTLSSISVSTPPTKTTYTEGEYFDPTGLVITRTYSDSTSDTYTYANHTSDFSFTPALSTALSIENDSVTITYGEHSCSQDITVNAAKTLSSISVSTAPTKTSYYAGDTFDPTGLVITRIYSDSTSDTYTYANHTSEFTFSPSTSTALTTGNTSVTITYGGMNCSQSITVQSVTLSSISVSTAPTKTSYTVDEYFSPTGLVITRNYNNGSSDTYTYAGHTSEFSFSPSLTTPLTTENTSVTITYGGKSCSQAITVSTSGGGGGSEEGSQRIVSNSGSSYFETGSIYFNTSGDNRTASCDAFNVNWNKNGSSNAIATTYDEIRVYASHSFTITPNSDYTITSIVITANNSSYANAVGGSSLTNCSKSVSNTTVTLNPTDGSSAVGFTNSAQSRLNYVVVNYEYESSSSPVVPTSISATVSKTYYVGETISASDITVKDNNNKTVSSFAFENDGYQFTYADASSGGALTNKTFTDAISGANLTCSLTVQIQRKAYASSLSTSEEHTGSEFSDAGIGSSYATGQTATVDGVTFNVDGYVYNETKLSLSSSKTSAPGKVVNTIPYSSGITNVSVNGASPDIQLSTDGSSWVDLSSATPDSTDYLYLKIFYKTTTQTNYVNITSISVALKGSGTAKNVANYVMYEDTNNQCTSKLSVALGYLSICSSSELTTFQNSSDYVISTARERLEAWARNQGKTIVYTTGNVSVTSQVLPIVDKLSVNNPTIIVIIGSVIGVSAVGGYFFIKKRKEN